METLTKKQQQALIDYQNHAKKLQESQNKANLSNKDSIKVIFQSDEGVLFTDCFKSSEIPQKGDILIWMRICFEVELRLLDYDNNCVCVNLVKL